MLLNIIEEYNINLLSTKIYWEKPKEREDYKKFWQLFKKISQQDSNEKQKEVLLLKNDLKKVNKDEKRYKLVINAYKKKLVELGEMRELKNNFIKTKKNYIKKK